MRTRGRAVGERSRLHAVMIWLRARRRLSLALAWLGVLLILAVDLVVPGYAVAGAYLVLVSFVAIALPQRSAFLVAGTGLALAIAVMVMQERTDAENVTLVWLGVLAGAGILALVLLLDRVQTLYEAEAERNVRSAFLVRLVDAMLPLSDPLAVQETLVRMLGERFEGGQSAFFEKDETGRLAERCAYDGGAARRLDLEPFRAALEASPPGSTLALSAEEEDAVPPPAGRAAGQDDVVSACLATALREDGELAAVVAVCDAAPRKWTEGERELLVESAGRAWAEVRRARSDATVALQAHLLANVHDAIVALDVHVRITYWNEAARELFGWTSEEALGRHMEELLHAAYPGSDRETVLATLLREGSYRGEVGYRHKDGYDLWTDIHARVVRGDAGGVEGVVLSVRDIGEQKRTQEALAWEAARLRAIVEAAPVGLGIVGSDGEVLMRNDVLRRIWMGEAQVTSVREFAAYRAFWPDTGEQLEPQDWPAAKALSDGSSFADVVVDIERFDGTRGTIVLSAAPIVDGGQILGAVTIVQDITGIRRAEQALRLLTEEVRALHEGLVMDRSLSSSELAADVISQAGLLLGSDGGSIFLLVNDSLCRVAGVGAPDPREVEDLAAQVVGERATAVRACTEDTDGGVLLGVPLVLREQVFGAMTFTYEDRRGLDEARMRIAEAFADQAALAIENARLRARIEQSAIEAERTRLARDLHDSVTQSLFAASLKAEALAESLRGDRGSVAGTAEELRRLTRGALAGMRTMLLEMRPDGLALTPLPELLRHLVEANGGRIGADVRLQVHGDRSLAGDVRTAFYRIAQEALNNVARHAGASDVRIELTFDDHVSRLEIRDDGIGFDPGCVPPGHFGLRTMAERAEGIGARLDVATSRGRGTVVTVEWPLGEGMGHHE